MMNLEFIASLFIFLLPVNDVFLTAVDIDEPNSEYISYDTDYFGYIFETDELEKPYWEIYQDKLYNENQITGFLNIIDNTQHSTPIELNASGTIKKVSKSSKCHRCPVSTCSIKYQHLTSLERHFETHHTTIKPYKCMLCTDVFRFESEIKVHIKLHNKSFPCTFITCNRVFTENGDRVKHITKTHPEISPYYCDLCGKRFNGFREMTRHRKSELSLPLFNCPISGCPNPPYSTGYKLADHLKSAHPGKEPFKCTLCPEKFLFQSLLDVHIKTHVRRFTCPDKHCNDIFTENGNRTKHIIKNHPEISPYPCVICEKGFPSAKSLRAHRPEHKGHIKCPHCDDLFSNNSLLRYHVNIHLGKNPYKCESCAKAFPSPIKLSRHKKTHREEKNHSCFHCKKSFRENKHLVIHERVHTGEKPFSCGHCTKSFSRNDRLREHVKKEHPEEITFTSGMASALNNLSSVIEGLNTLTNTKGKKRRKKR